MQRAHPSQGTRAPAHGFGPWEIADRVFQHLGHDVRRRAPGFVDHGKRLSLWCRRVPQARRGQTCAAQEPFDRLFGASDFGAFAFFTAGGLWPARPRRSRSNGAVSKRPRRRIGQTRLDQPSVTSFFRSSAAALACAPEFPRRRVRSADQASVLSAFGGTFADCRAVIGFFPHR